VPPCFFFRCTSRPLGSWLQGFTIPLLTTGIVGSVIAHKSCISSIGETERSEALGFGTDSLLHALQPSIIPWGLNGLDDLQAVACQGFGGLPVDGGLWEALQVLQGGPVEVN
jgi:hypothetical protein